MDEWISVEDRIPDLGTTVNIQTSDGREREGQIMPDGGKFFPQFFCWQNSDGYWIRAEGTHWKPLAIQSD